MLEIVDDIPETAEWELPLSVRRALWAKWDRDVAPKRVKLKWGIFRPSFKLRVFEPVVAKLLGPRP